MTIRFRGMAFIFTLLGSGARLIAAEPFGTLFPRGYPSGLLLESPSARAAAWHLPFPSEIASSGLPPWRSLARSSASPIGANDAGEKTGSAADRRIFDTKTILATSGILLSVATAGYSKWWSGNSTAFHFRSEGFFGQNTYAGGMDKASHFVISSIFFEPVDRFFRVLDHPPSESGVLALGTVIGMGAVVEVGDGFGTGASWEDLAADTAGALAAFLLHKNGLDDTAGFRLGWIPTHATAGVYRPGAFDVDYSQEIYSADLKLNGLLRRLHLSPGIARFLLLSATYDTKGYGQTTVPVTSRERNLGVALGLNLVEIARALGVPEEFWWSRPIYGFLTYFRIPYTAFGFRYDLNHHRWQGPDTGERYNPRAGP